MNAGDFKSKSGTRIINLLVPMAFRSSLKVIAEMVYELRKVGTSAADLKSLYRKRRNEPRDFKSKSGTRIINLLVPMAFRSSLKVIAEMVYELRKVGTSGLILTFAKEAR